jgi:hypothetical protein
MIEGENSSPRHRATYIFEMGMWRATCQICGHSVVESKRGLAASGFRAHIRACASAATESKRKGTDSPPSTVVT